MFVVTNRQLDESASGLSVFEKHPSERGPNELRLVEVSNAKNPTVTVLENRLSTEEVVSLEREFDFEVDKSQKWYASLAVACRLFERAVKEKKHLLFYVHGYNNDMADILRTARALESLYDVVVVPFSWPANGGGPISGTAAYLSDKDDARSSATALHRMMGKVSFYHQLLTEGLRRRLWAEAGAKHPHDHEKARALFSRLVDRQCKVTLNLLCHSMGNYVLKYATVPSGSSLRGLLFDNISLVAADVNNPDHEQWVEAIPVRNRLYVVINENDGALKWSRRKPGAEQRERLGHHLRNLVARNAYYLDVTRNRGVGTDHSYFKGEPVENNATLKRTFARAFEGGNAETGMDFFADLNLYRS